MANLRRRAHEILDQTRADDRPAALLSGALIVLITANVVAIVLKSEPGIDAAWHRWFDVLELVSVLLFSLEYATRVWAAIEREPGRYRAPVAGRIRYMLTPLALIDLIAILPFYLGVLSPLDLRFMRIFRLLLIFKLTRYQASMTLLVNVLRREAGPIGAAVFVLAMLLVVAASFAYLAEHEAQPQVFASIPDAMWWAIVTMTAVGYGDMVPVTPFGKVVGGVIAIIGLGMVALPAGLLASGFSEQLHERRREFEAAVARTLAGGGDHARGGRRAEGDPQPARPDRPSGRRDRAPDRAPAEPRALPALRRAAGAGTRSGRPRPGAAVTAPRPAAGRGRRAAGSGPVTDSRIISSGCAQVLDGAGRGRAASIAAMGRRRALAVSGPWLGLDAASGSPELALTIC